MTRKKIVAAPLTLLRRIIFLLLLVLAAGLVGAGLCIYVNPQQLWWLAFLGLLFPYLLAINIFLLFFWVIVRFRYMWLSLVALLISLPVSRSYFAFHFTADRNRDSPHSISVMTYNARNFDLYNWSGKGNTADKMLGMIKTINPDVVCFQEFFNADTGKYALIQRLMKSVGFRYFVFEKNVERDHFGAWGLATFSKYPIKGQGDIRFDNSKFNSALFTDILFDSITVRVFNAHLQSVYLSQKDYEYIEHVSNNQEVQVKPTRQIFSKFKQGFIKRAPQVLRMTQEISKSPYPVIVCGDFNDTPASFTYHSIASGLQDAFLASGWGIAPTYSGLFSYYRIDYIFTDKRFGVSHYATHCEKYSDHYAVTCRIAFHE